MATWKMKRGERVVGPVDTNHLKKMGLEGKLLPTDLIQKVGEENWVAAGNVRGLSLAHTSTPQNKIQSAPKAGSPTQDGGPLGHPNPPNQNQRDSTGGLIPYKNAPALIAYYISLLSLLPILGIPFGIAAFILGIIGLRKRAANPAIKGAAHAWIGIILGGGTTVLWVVLIVCIFVVGIFNNV